MLGELGKDMRDLQYVVEYFGGGWIPSVSVFQCVSPILLDIKAIDVRVPDRLCWLLGVFDTEQMFDTRALTIEPQDVYLVCLWNRCSFQPCAALIPI